MGLGVRKPASDPLVTWREMEGEQACEAIRLTFLR